jgi:hypothetical protein
MFLGSVLPILQMVSNYKRKTTQGSWTEQDMKRANYLQFLLLHGSMVSHWVHYTDISKNLQIRNKNNRAGKAWLQGFMARNSQLAFRSLEPTTIACLLVFSK